MIVTICGPPGSGKDTAALRVVKALKDKGFHFTIISMGDLRGEAAVKKGMTIEDYNKWSLDNPIEGDKYFDDYQKNLAKEKDDFFMVSRLGWYFIPSSFKIYIDVDEIAGATRVFNQKKKYGSRADEKPTNSVEEQMLIHRQRVESDKQRYKKLYGINPYDKSNYDFVIDSTKLSPGAMSKAISEKVLERMKK